ncbi:type VII secretion target [Saccharomonospora azurea]|uniref:type VII secretion target n=1 Tax=Saccharomonospora azurea TaxID=40988 RepID=UPI003D918EC1
MSAPITVETEVMHKGADQLDDARDTALRAAQTARDANGAPDAFGASGQARAVADAWAALTATRADEMESLAKETDALAGKVRQAADAYTEEDSDNAHDMDRHGEGLGAGERVDPGEGRGAGGPVGGDQGQGEGLGAGDRAEPEGQDN